ncbi:hypothetical protein Moror_4939 [Moniliophthora roreri MCA 2997]|uniref:MARVEL domain-containing protein n=2 Tax=Moniliophthora roreri TaxID=221103 RepID=V2WXZ4_MONRO|nr:hypothetical protein Moror_4939 [Moniliophthora roreri MCA 2997]KAI3612095.1 hypothetical protein WG66_016162 [Moniliophthora roreri]
MARLDFIVVRIWLYITLLVFSFILFALCCARINYTTNLSFEDPLNEGRRFYDPVVVELLVATLLTMGWCAFMIFLYFKDTVNPVIRHYREELIVLLILWLLWLGGAAAASDIWGGLNWCQQFQPCRVLSALLAFAWLGFITLTAIIGVSSYVSWSYGGLVTPLHRRDSSREKNPAASVTV